MIGVRRDNIPLMRVSAGVGQWDFKNLIGWAIGIGVIFGLVFALINPSQSPDSIATSISKSNSQVASSKSDSSELIKTLESHSKQASQRIEELERKIQNLTREAELKDGESMNQKRKAGSFGTVKGTRTSPTVIPDESLNPRLSEILSRVAIDRELIVALANSNVKDILEVWFQSIKRVGISNYLVVALDDEMVTYCQENDVPVYKRDPDERIDGIGRDGGNRAVSGLKFAVLREFLQLGYSVILSDIDIVYLQNPFNFLYRDSDVESMTDGHDNITAYGYNEPFDDPSMGWARYVNTIRIWVYNSGFFYIRPTIPSIELLDRVRSRLANDPEEWDQTIFNQELFYPSYPGYDGLHASRRTMDYFLFMNSKVLFKIVKDDETLSKQKPVVVHVNYHPDKLPRMKAVVKYYVDGIDDALESFPDGSES